MSIARTVTVSYSGGLPAAIQGTTNHTGQSAFSAETICTGGVTTTLVPAIALDPDASVNCYAFKATGDCTLHFDLASGTDTSVALTANTPLIQEAVAGDISYLPSPVGNDTLTLRVIGPGSDTFTFTGDMLIT